jgi:hypothetical protein
MVEKDLVANGEPVSYTGVFKSKDLFKDLKTAFKDRGYKVREAKHTESLKKEGRYIKVVWEIGNQSTDYVMKKGEIGIVIDNLKDKYIQKKGKREKYQEGELEVEFTAWVESDYAKRWAEDKPIIYVLRTLLEQYIYSPYSVRVNKELRGDIDAIKKQLQSILNLYKL